MNQSFVPRFWALRGDPIYLENGGFLRDPEIKSIFVDNPRAEQVNFMSAAACLALLGEPGIGKSSCLESARCLVTQGVLEQGAQLLWIDLHEVGSDAEFHRRFDDSAAYREWLHGDYKLHVYFDSLDECRMQVKTLPRLILSVLQNCPIDRLTLRIACRSADWPNSLEQGLNELWEDRFQVRELLPLTKIDAIASANTSGLDGVQFIEQVVDFGVASFAAQPVTLQFLISTFRLSGSLILSRDELYREGCKRLCDQTESRLELLLPSALSSRQKMEVCARIAALMIFGNRAAVWLGAASGDNFGDDVLVPELSGWTESVEGDCFDIDEQGVREAFNTALFTSRGTERLGWSHQSYAEFLAAYYVTSHDFPVPQIMNLIVHSGDSGEKISPQLAEVAAWTASLDNQVFDAILERDPIVLLRADNASQDEARRRKLVQILLSKFDAGDFSDRDWDIRNRYKNLKHSGISEQLRPYIVDESKNEEVRRVAMHIAGSCRLVELGDDLVSVVLDESNALDTRMTAGYVVKQIGTADHRGALRSLLDVDPAQDPDGELKGIALQNLWPDCMSTEELFVNLTPFQGNVLGSYKSFVYDNPTTRIPVEDLPSALVWVNLNLESDTYPDEFGSLINTVMERSWQNIGEAEILTELVRTVVVRMKEESTIFGWVTSRLWTREQSPSREIMRTDVSGRRKLFNAVIEIEASSDLLSQLTQYGVIDGFDFDWLMERYGRSDEIHRESWAHALMVVFQPENQHHVEKVFDDRQEDDVLKEASSIWFDTMPIDSDAADVYQAFKRYEDEGNQRDAEKESANAHTRRMFIERSRQFDEGNLDAWWELHLEMGQDDARSDYESDLIALPGWNALGESEHSWFVEAAEIYICEKTPSSQSWIHDRNSIFRPDWAGYRAFRFLRTSDPGRLERFPPDVWRRWAPVLVAFPFQSDSEAHAIQREFIQVAYRHAPNIVISTTIELLRREQTGYVGNVVGLLEPCWDERIAKALLEFAKDQRLTDNAFELILSAGVGSRSETAIGLAAEAMEDAGAYPAGWKEAATRVLWRHEPEQFWEILWAGVTQNEETLDMVARALAYVHQAREGFPNKLSEQHLADLYILLEQRYPHSEDGASSSRFGEISTRQTIGWLRDGLLSELVSRGSHAGCDQITRIQTRLPEIVWLKWRLQEAQQLLRIRTWAPPSVGEIRSLLRSADRRLILSGNGLMEVVLESLVRLQGRLKENQPPMVAYLWNEKPLRPKDEERLSDFIKDHLDGDIRDRAIIINREVVNRCGDETDIRVETFKRGGSGEKLDLIEMVIEVKGRWNAGLKVSMETQLVARYMTDNSVSQGIYVVGWFDSSGWDPDDSRSKKHRNMSLAQAKDFFASQAISLTSTGRNVQSVVLDLSM